MWRQTGLTFGAIWSLAVNPADPDRLLAGTWGSVRFGDEQIGIFLSQDGGDGWAQILESDPVVSLEIHPGDPTSVYAGTFGDGVLHSRDAGATWASISATLPELNVWSVALDPTRDGRVFAGTWGGGVYRTDDNGAVWRQMGQGLPSPNVYSIAVDPRDPNVLFAGTSTGVFQYHIDDSMPLGTDNPGSTKLSFWGDVKAPIEMQPNFPNPFNPDTWIPYTLATRQRATIRIYDVGGGVVRILNLGAKDAGKYATRKQAAYWDGRLADGTPAPSGVYIAEMDLGSRQSFRRMVLSR